MKSVARISGMKRLAMGFTVIAAGIACALPFRHTASDQSPVVGGSMDHPSPLDAEVALQVPGQRAMASFSPAILRPLPVTEESTDKGVEPAALASLLSASEPPKLPDQYRPLFRPESSQPLAARSVRQPSATSDQPIRRPVKQHTIHDGDTLESLARRYYGDPQRAGAILAANPTVLSDPEVLPIGVKIVIPRQEAEVSVADISSDADSSTKNLVPLPATGLRRGR